jgi:predicted DNA-binding transcriptional regulator AlpA
MSEENASLYMRRNEIKNIHPVSDKARQRAEAAGLFPRRIQLAPHIPVWRRSDIAAWRADPNAWAKQSGAVA